jgi:hypothetical protein
MAGKRVSSHWKLKKNQRVSDSCFASVQSVSSLNGEDRAVPAPGLKALEYWVAKKRPPPGTDAFRDGSATGDERIKLHDGGSAGSGGGPGNVGELRCLLAPHRASAASSPLWKLLWSSYTSTIEIGCGISSEELDQPRCVTLAIFLSLPALSPRR